MQCKVCEKESYAFMNFNMPLAGSFLEKATDKNKHYPLTLCFCKNCRLVQVEEEIDAAELFETYMYKTGFIKTLVDHFKNFSQELLNNYKFNNILEIGCNDFSFLKNFNNKISIGVDPSDISRKSLCENSHIDLHNTYFNKKTAEEILNKYNKIDVIYSSNCFAHIPQIKDVAEGVSVLMSDESIFIVEVHWLGTLVKELQFPFIYHEHTFYYSLESLSNLLNLYDIEIYKTEHIPIHGGSIRYYCCKKGSKKIEDSVFDLRHEEEKLKLYDFDTFLNFTQRVNLIKNKINHLIDSVNNNNEKIVAYGASGQANTFLSYCEIDKNKIDYIIDDSPIKIGRFTSSGLIPIKSSSVLYEQKPDYILCLAYTFFSEIMNKHNKLYSKWIIPLP
jgi:methylation protein EvaC